MMPESAIERRLGLSPGRSPVPMGDVAWPAVSPSPDFMRAGRLGTEHVELATRLSIADLVDGDTACQRAAHCVRFESSAERDASRTTLLKCVLVGDHGVGKSCLVSRYVLDEFPDGDQEPEPTVLDHYNVTLSVDGQPTELRVADTSGLNDFSAFRKLCYPSADVFLLCFSVVQPSSLHHILEKWLPEVRNHCPNTPVLLIGTQCDLRQDEATVDRLRREGQRVVSAERARRWGKVLKLPSYVECSAVAGMGLKEVFDEAIWLVLKHRRSVAVRETRAEKKQKKALGRSASADPWLQDTKSKSKTPPSHASAPSSTSHRDRLGTMFGRRPSQSEDTASPHSQGSHRSYNFMRKVRKIFSRSLADDGSAKPRKKAEKRPLAASKSVNV